MGLLSFLEETPGLAPLLHVYSEERMCEDKAAGKKDGKTESRSVTKPRLRKQGLGRLEFKPEFIFTKSFSPSHAVFHVARISQCKVSLKLYS